MATKAKAAPAPAEEVKPSDFVYVGQRLLADGSAGTAIQLIDYEGGVQILHEKVWMFDGKHGKKWVVGGIYTGASFGQTTAIGLPSAQWNGHAYGQFKDRAGWIAKDAQIHDTLRLERMRKDATRVNEIEKVMTPLRQVYQDMRDRGDYEGMHALTAMVRDSLQRKVT